MKSVRNITLGVASLLALILGIGLFPIALLALAGNPIDLGGIDSLTSPFNDNAIIHVIAMVCWVAWTLFVISLLTETVGWIRDKESPTVPLTGAFARRVVLSIALLLTTAQRPPVSLATQLTPISSTAAALPNATPPETQPVADSTPNHATEHIPYKVQPRDDLWTLAERHLGDPLRWRELYEINEGTPQDDGRMLASPQLLRPGWTLMFPNDAVGLPETSTHDEPTFNGPTTVNQESPVGQPNAMQGTPDNSDESTFETEQDVSDHDDANVIASAFKWTLAGTGILLAVDRIRRRRRRHRMPGTVTQSPNARLSKAEALLRAESESTLADRLNMASRALAHCLINSSSNASVEAVRVGDDGIEFLFDAPVVSAPGPFFINDDGRAWTLDSSVHEVRVGALAAEMPAPMPALVHTGTLDHAAVMIDLESHGITSLVGDNSSLLAASFAQQLAMSDWSDHVDVVTVGVPAPNGLTRIRAFDAIADIPPLVTDMAKGMRSALIDAGFETTFAARTTNELSDGWVPTVVVVSEEAATGDRLNELVMSASQGRQGLSIVVVGHADVAHRVIDVGISRTIVSAPQMVVDSLDLHTENIDAVNSLVDEALNGDAVEYALPDLGIDLREIVDVPTPADVTACVLGPIRIDGGHAEIGRSRSVEAVVYLALHPQGVTDDRLKEALWPDRLPTVGTFNTTISLARRQLGTDQSGVSYVPPVKDRRYRVSENVDSDLSRFETLFALAKSASEPEAVRLLSGALELVRGKPFDDTPSGYSWAHVEGFIARAEAIVADAAHMLAGIHLENGDASSATWAARKGLLASPGYEVLYRDLMLACEVDGNLAALETIMAELNTLLDTVDPDDNLESETTELYNRLRSRRATVGSR